MQIKLFSYSTGKPTELSLWVNYTGLY